MTFREAHIEAMIRCGGDRKSIETSALNASLNVPEAMVNAQVRPGAEEEFISELMRIYREIEKLPIGTVLEIQKQLRKKSHKPERN